MGVRTLVNLAYAALAENRDTEQLAELDAILAGADRTVARAQAHGRKGGAAQAGKAPGMTPGERLLARTPNNPMGLAAMMAGVQARTR